MASTKNVDRTPSGRLTYRGESFSGYNKPKRTPGKSKKSAVLAKKGDQVKLVRFGDPKMAIKIEVLSKLEKHEAECNLRYERIEEKLGEQKNSLHKLDYKIWAIALLIVVTPVAHKFLGQ